MALNAKNAPMGGGKQRDPLEAGAYPARLVQVIDLGLQPQSYQGQEKSPARMIGLTYELLDEFLKDDDGEDQLDKPLWFTETMALHNIKNDKAKSTLRYRVLDPNEDADGDFTALLGTPVMVALTTTPGKGKNAGRIYNNVAGITAMREKDVRKAPELVNVPAFFDLDDPDVAVFNSLPDWVQQKIKANLEFSGSRLEQLLGKEGNAPAKQAPVAEESDDDDPPY